jgi:phosphate:Na+ symporter
MLGTIFRLLGSIGIFLYGMRVLSTGLQKAAGNRMQIILNFMTSNRFIAIFTGFFITALVQSSSATTVMVVSFVNASLLSLTQAIGVIMGANIGTTVTTWIVSYFGFKFNISSIALPIIGIGFPFVLSKLQSKRSIGEVFIGFGLLLLGLVFLKESVPNIKDNPEILAFLQDFTDLGFVSFLLFVVVGTILTVIVQSSSAAMAITVTMAFKGWIEFDTAAAIVLGENIGTTVTAFLASIGTTVNARRAARAHMLFNIFGVIWMSFMFTFFIRLVLIYAPWESSLQENLPLNLSLFHTAFNVINTLLFIPLIKPFTQLVEKLVKPNIHDQTTQYKLSYITIGTTNPSDLNVIKAKKELIAMASIIDEMFHNFLILFNNPQKKMGDTVEKLKSMEELTDEMQQELTDYLVHCSQENLSEKNVKNVNAMMRIVNELEHIADSCMKLTYLLKRRYDNQIDLHDKAFIEINHFSELIQSFINLYKDRIVTPSDQKVLEIAFELEKKINQSRDHLKIAAQYRLQQGSQVQAELLYLDLLKHFEHIGDNSLNIVQALRNMK